MKDVEDNISELNEENEPQKKKKIPTLADTIVSNKGRYYGCGGGT